jgi:hypothetical protein
MAFRKLKQLYVFDRGLVTLAVPGNSVPDEARTLCMRGSRVAPPPDSLKISGRKLPSRYISLLKAIHFQD